MYSPLNLREDEGQEEVLENKDEEEEEEIDIGQKVKEVRECSTHACDMVMTMGCKHLGPMYYVQKMSVTTTKKRLTTRTATLRACSRVPQVFQVAAHIVGFRVVLRVDFVLRVVNSVLVAVIVHSICIPNSCIFQIAKTGLFRCCLHKFALNGYDWIHWVAKSCTTIAYR